VAYPGTFRVRGFNKFSWGQRAERTGIWGRQPPSQGFRSICKWVKPVFWLGCYGCIFHGTGNSAQLCQNFGITGEGGVWTPLGTPLAGHFLYLNFFNVLRWITAAWSWVHEKSQHQTTACLHTFIAHGLTNTFQPSDSTIRVFMYVFIRMTMEIRVWECYTCICSPT
jgi:hypothetical protein